MNKLRKFIFNLIRKYTWSDYDANERFGCMQCGKQMLNRYLFCSTKCTDEFEKKLMKQFVACESGFTIHKLFCC